MPGAERGSSIPSRRRPKWRVSVVPSSSSGPFEDQRGPKRTSTETRNVGSIYVELLNAALDARAATSPPSASKALAHLISFRRRVIGSRSGSNDGEWAAGALAEQVAYDAALIAYARRTGIECGPDGFGTPVAERQRIERMLEAKGIPLSP